MRIVSLFVGAAVIKDGERFKMFEFFKSILRKLTYHMIFEKVKADDAEVFVASDAHPVVQTWIGPIIVVPVRAALPEPALHRLIKSFECINLSLICLLHDSTAAFFKITALVALISLIVLWFDIDSNLIDTVCFVGLFIHISLLIEDLNIHILSLLVLIWALFEVSIVENDRVKGWWEKWPHFPIFFFFSHADCENPIVRALDSQLTHIVRVIRNINMVEEIYEFVHFGEARVIFELILEFSKYDLQI